MEVFYDGDELGLGISCNFTFSLVGVISNNKKLGEH